MQVTERLAALQYSSIIPNSSLTNFHSKELGNYRICFPRLILRARQRITTQVRIPPKRELNWKLLRSVIIGKRHKFKKPRQRYVS